LFIIRVSNDPIHPVRMGSGLYYATVTLSVHLGQCERRKASKMKRTREGLLCFQDSSSKEGKTCRKTEILLNYELLLRM